MMKKQELRSGMRVWSWQLHRYLYYNGMAYNAKDFEFADANDRLFILSKKEVDELRHENEVCK